jgi:hypothetical protein
VHEIQPNDMHFQSIVVLWEVVDIEVAHYDKIEFTWMI